MASGRIDEARKSLAAAVKRDPEVMADDLVLMQWATRQPGVDEKAVQRVLNYTPGTDPLEYRAIRGQTDEIFAIIQDEHEDPSMRMQLYQLLRQVAAAPLMADPRAKQLLRKYGFEAYWREKGWPALCHPLGSDDFECAPALAKAG